MMKKRRKLDPAKEYGIIRYAPCSGASCDEDVCAFDGWYGGEWGANITKQTFLAWKRDFPDWIIAIVERTDYSHFPGKIWRTIHDPEARYTLLTKPRK